MSRFFVFILVLFCASSAEARIDLPPIVVAPGGTSSQISPPSLTGYKNLNGVVLYWNTAQTITHTVIEESTNGISWQQVYQGLGSPRVGGPEPMAFAQISPSKTELSSDIAISKQVTPNYRKPIVCPGSCGPTTNYSRLHMLTAKAGSYYLYRAKNCSLSLCSEYSNELVLGTPPPLAPASVSVLSSSNNGSVAISWSAVSTATSYTLQESVNNGAWTPLTSANRTSYSRSGLATGNYKYQVRACSASGCSDYTISNGIVISDGTIEKLNYEVYQDASGNIYLVRPPTFIPIAGDIFVPIFIADKGNVIVMTKNGAFWSLTEITYEKFISLGTNIVREASVRYENLTGNTGLDLIISLSGNFADSIVVNDINATTHQTSNWDCSRSVCVATGWKDFAKVTVPNASGSDTAPSESVDLSAASLKGQASVSGGQASYQIPIDLPPGRNGVQPSVSLSYSSQGGNGLLGVGWSLNAGSSISRCGATFAQDGFTRAVTFSATNDRLCLDGQRLVAISGIYGASGTEYRTEMDSFVKVVQSGGINDSSSYFTVYKADGTSASYGSDTNSRFSPSGLSTVLSWKVTQESYSNGANTIDYQYDTSVAGEHLLSKIYYTGSTAATGDRIVKLSYQDRVDKRQSYMAGGKLVMSRRLFTIETLIHQNERISLYTLTYDDAYAGIKSLLKNVQQCADSVSGQSCALATEFNWYKNKSKFNIKKLAYTSLFDNAGRISEIMPAGDANGDGVLDFPDVFINAEGEVTGINSNNFKKCIPNQSLVGESCVTFDVNNDGKTDGYYFNNNVLNLQVTMNNSDSTKNINTDIFLNQNESEDRRDTIVNASDYNGDGFVDLLVYKYDGRSSKIVLYSHTRNINSPYLNNGKVVFDFNTIPLGDSSLTFSKSLNYIGDFDGNGLPDFTVSFTGLSHNQLGYVGTPTPMPIGVVLSESNGTFRYKSLDFFTPNTLDNFMYFFNLFTDINADGLVDWVGWKTNSNKLYYRLNNGGSLTDYIPLALGIETRSYTVGFANNGGSIGEPYNFYVPKYINSFRQLDIDNDGIPELLMPDERLIIGCANILVPSWPKRMMVNKAMCGDELYGEYYSSYIFDTNIRQRATSLIPVEQLDSSVYSYKGMKFELGNDGVFRNKHLPTGIIATSRQTAVTDINGDGLSDFVFVSSDPSKSFTWRLPANRNIEGFNGNGVFVNQNYGAGMGVNNSDYHPTDYLKSVTDGLGNSSQWRYRPLSTGEASAGQSKLYSTDHNEVGTGYVHFASSMYVVQSFKQSNGQGSLNDTQYAYKGAMYNLQGRGFTGFNQLWEKDMQRNKTVHSTFKQKFPEVGLLTSQKVSVAGVTVQQTTNTWADNPQHSVTKVYHNMLTKSVQTSKDLTGTALSTQETLVAASDVDQWGNVKKRTQKTTDYIKGQANTYESVTETLFNPDTANWWLNKFTWTQSSTQVAVRGWSNDPAGTSDKAQWQRQTVNTWNTTHKQPVNVTYSASGTSCTRVEATSLNAYGLPTSVSATGQSSTCAALTARTSSFSYTKDGATAAVDGYLPHTVTNAKGHVTTTQYDMGLGVPTKVTAPNSIVTQTEYDAIGRPVQVKQTGSPTQYLRYLTAENGANLPNDNSNNAVVMTRTSGAGQPETEQYFDSQGRVLRLATQGFNGGYQYTDKHYDALGRLLRESIPYGNGTSAEYTEFSDFDALDRPGRRSIPNGKSGLESTYSYNGLTTDISVGGRSMSRTYGSQGWLYETVDAQGGSNRFAYDSAGRPLVIQDANAKNIVASYNGFGHKTKVIDPNQGTTVFGYNSLGELDKQNDANGVVQTYALDTLGRISSKSTTGGNAPGTATYVWDTPKLGLLSSETENGITRSYAYTSALQLASTTVTVDGVARTIKHQYDSFFGRPKGLQYPNGLTLKYGYNDYGYLSETSNAASGYVYRTVTDMDEAGHITGAKLANSLMTESRAYNGEGTMASVEVDGPLGRIHGHYYDGYDEFMNLITERNATTGLNKTYGYDTLNRLTNYSFSNSNPNFNATVGYAYDKVGNFLKKTDYSANTANAYRYGGDASCAAGNNAGPNAVCQLTKLNNTTVNFRYDNRGNLLVGDGLTMTYNAMDKPLTITGRGETTGFVYGSDGMRAKQTRSSDNTTYYVDKYYEVDNDGSWRAYLDDIAVLSYTPARQHLLQFTLRDRLGSATTMADQNGNIVSQRYFDPFGRTADVGNSHRLDMLNKNTALSVLKDLAVTNKNRRGFTDHEHLNEQQLIHMNGRVYDYNLGRFLSVDPLIQSPTSTQSVNPYSYIMNNPLAGTDPTGYCSTGTRIKGNDAIGCSVSFDAGSGGSGKKKSEAKITNNGGNNYTASFQLDKKTTLEVDFKVNDIGSLGAKNAMWTDQYGDPSSIPAGFNGTETANNGFEGWGGGTPHMSDPAMAKAVQDGSGQAGFAGAVLLTGGTAGLYVKGAGWLVTFALVPASGGDMVDVALARLPVVNKVNYSSIKNPPSIGPGKDFTLRQKMEALELNKVANGGVVKSDLSGTTLVQPQKSQRGVIPDRNEWQFDHKTSKNCGGTNCSSNLQILSREENRAKWDK